MHTALPVPTLPNGWKLATSSLHYRPSTRVWELSRAWTPTGSVPGSPFGPQVNLRVYTLQPGAWPAVPTNFTLANGTSAYAHLSMGRSQIEWRANGLDYMLNASSLGPTEVVAAANSLP